MPGFGGTAVSHLLHFQADHRAALVSRIFPVADVLEKGVIPFAEDIGGDLFCFSYRADYDAPPVLFWSASTGPILLAASFADFLAMLRDD